MYDVKESDSSSIMGGLDYKREVERAESPINQVITRQELLMRELESAVAHIEEKVNPMRAELPSEGNYSAVCDKPVGNSAITRTIEELSNRLSISIARIRQITEELEI